MPESARSSPLFPLRTPDPASTHPALPHPPDPHYPGLQATPRRLMHQSRNVSARPAPLMTHRHIYFAGTLAYEVADAVGLAFIQHRHDIDI